MFARRNDTSFDSSFILLFLAFQSQFLLLTMIDQCLIAFAINFETVSQIYRSKEARIRKRVVAKIYTTHDGELTIFLSHIHAFYFSLFPFFPRE